MKIVYFDGYCNVCNAFVDFLIRRDPRGRLRFASLQSSTAQARLPARYSQDVNTMVFEDDGQISEMSAGALRSIAALGGAWALVRVFLLVPRFLRDGVYQWVAKHRYLWFGKRETCRIATPEELERFLS